MDVVMLSRIQFAVTIFFHFVFVPLTLGLSVLLAVMETIYVRTGDIQYKRMAKFWGKLFLINFALGVVTGITLEFQFGTNWSNYSHGVGDVFGSLLAIEATLAFFLESTFIAVWHFGWDRVSKKVHCFAIWAVAIGGNLSAVWIILANGWMQNPVGAEFVDGKAVLIDFWAVVSNPYAWGQFFHTILGSWLLGGFFVLGVSAWHLVRKNEVDFFEKSFRLAAIFAVIAALGVAFQGHRQGMLVAKYQPAKLAAMEAHWETSSSVPMYLLVLPDDSQRKNIIEAIPVPGVLSFLAHGDFNAEVEGINQATARDYADFVASTKYDPYAPVATIVDTSNKFNPETPLIKPVLEKDAKPPVLLTFLSFRLMVGLGTLFPILAIAALLWRRSIGERPLFARILIWNIPLPYIAIMTGWMVAEVGRQPWLVYKQMLTVQGISSIPASSVWVSLGTFIVVYGLLGVLDIYLLRKYAQKGPEA